MQQETMRRIATNLKNSGELEKYSGHSDPVEIELSYDLCEIIDSAQNIVSTLWPRIAETSNARKAGEALFELREELRHVLYHVETSKYFSIICSDQRANDP